MEGFTITMDQIIGYVPYLFIALEVVQRIWPSNKVRSYFSYAGKILHKIGDLCYALNDALGELVPDKPGVDDE